MKQSLKKLIDKAGFILTKKQSYHDNHKWLSDLNIKTVIDVGANSGQFANSISTALPGCQIHSFEPIAATYKQLVAKTNHLKIKTYPFALGAKEEEVEMNANEFSPSSSILELADLHKTNFDYATKTNKETIQVRRADSILDHKQLDKNILTKIDVQGFEDQVILGGRELINNSKVLICEVSFKELYKGQKLFGDIYSLAQEMGFSFMGTIDQLYNYENGQIISGDAIFIK